MADDGEIAELVGRSISTTGFSGVVRVDRDDREVLCMAAGSADRRHDIPNSPSTRFGIASGTKGFTALTMMSLVANGSIGLDDTIRPHLGSDLPMIDDEVTVRHLLAHRSGIGDYLDEESGGDINDHVMAVPVHQLSSAEAYLAVLDGFPQRERPGAAFRYNNSGYVILAIVAERAVGRSYHQLVEERVVRAAGLGATSFERGDELPGGVATGYLSDDGLRTNVLHLPVIGVGDGGIISCVDDLHRLWQAVFAGRVVPSDLVASMVAPVSDAPTQGGRYGLGFWLPQREHLVALEGIDAGVSFRSVHDPTTALTATVVSNTSSGAWPVIRVLEEALGLR